MPGTQIEEMQTDLFVGPTRQPHRHSCGARGAGAVPSGDDGHTIRGNEEVERRASRHGRVVGDSYRLGNLDEHAELIDRTDGCKRVSAEESATRRLDRATGGRRSLWHDLRIGWFDGPLEASLRGNDLPPSSARALSC